MHDERYPLGRFVPPDEVSFARCQELIAELEALPGALAAAVADLDDAQLDTPYRDGGWTVRQVVHHLADSHLNAYTRHKLAMTEHEPTIRPYAEAAWAELGDGKSGEIGVSRRILEALHERWVRFLRTLGAEDFERRFFHPASQRWFTLGQSLALYVWHGRHHVAHVTSLRAARGW